MHGGAGVWRQRRGGEREHLAELLLHLVVARRREDERVHPRQRLVEERAQLLRRLRQQRQQLRRRRERVAVRMLRKGIGAIVL